VETLGVKMNYCLNRDLSMQYHDSWKKMFAFSFGDGEALTGGAGCCFASSHLFGNFGRPPDVSSVGLGGDKPGDFGRPSRFERL
jgi:hypothetical protein